MKTVSADFLAMLADNAVLVEADLYTFTLASGTVLRYTSAQVDVIYGGNTYKAAFLDSAPGFHRGQWSCTRGLQSNELDIDVLFDASTLINGAAPAAFVNAGGFDNAQVRLDKALAPNWSNPVVNGVVNLFVGIVGQAKTEAGKIELTVNDMLAYLQTTFPRNYVLPQCNHCLFSAGCGLSKASFAVSGTVTSTGGSPTNTVFSTNLTQADGWFALGSVVWTSGANNGLACAVKAYANSHGQVTLIYPVGVIPSVGDTFTAYPGCDKTQSTCTTKFSNIANFRGFPFVPTPETLEVGGQGSQPPVTTGGAGGAGLRGIARGPGGQSGSFEQF